MSVIATAERSLQRPAERPDPARSRLSPAEIDARRESLAASAHESIIEGACPDRATDYIFEAYIRGHIDAADMIPWLDKHYGVMRAE